MFHSGGRDAQAQSEDSVICNVAVRPFRAFLTDPHFRTFHSEARCATHRFRIGHMWYTVITCGDVAVAGSQRSSVHGPLHVREAGQMNGVCV